MIDIQTFSRTELEALLKELRLYRSASKKIGKRSRMLFSQNKAGIRVELAPGATLESVQNILHQLHISPSSLESSVNENLSGWARIFIGDDLIALSFNDIIQKI